MREGDFLHIASTRIEILVNVGEKLGYVERLAIGAKGDAVDRPESCSPFVLRTQDGDGTAGITRTERARVYPVNLCDRSFKKARHQRKYPDVESSIRPFCNACRRGVGREVQLRDVDVREESENLDGAIRPHLV